MNCLKHKSYLIKVLTVTVPASSRHCTNVFNYLEQFVKYIYLQFIYEVPFEMLKVSYLSFFLKYNFLVKLIGFDQFNWINE